MCVCCVCVHVLEGGEEGGVARNDIVCAVCCMKRHGVCSLLHEMT